MEERKNIDRLFQEKFKDFEVAPNDSVWDRINESLPNKKKKRRIIALWWQFGGVAALIALLLTIGFSVFNTDESNTQELPFVNIEDKNNIKAIEDTQRQKDKIANDFESTEKKGTKIVDSNNKKSTSSNSKSLNQEPSPYIDSSTKSPKQTSKAIVNNKKQNEARNKFFQTQKKSEVTHTDIKLANNNTKSTDSTSENVQLISEKERKSAIQQNKSTVTQNLNSSKENSELLIKDELIEKTEKNAIENAIAENNETIIEKENERNRWSIAPNVAPVYFNSLGQGSSIDNQFNENTKSSDVNMSYGISGSYAISNKLKIRAGVNRVSLNQSTNDILAFTGTETASRGIDGSFNNINFSNGVQTISLMSSDVISRSSAPELLNTKVSGKLDQRFGFIEVPLELEYRLLNNKFGINIIGGFSTFFLSENNIYVDIDGTSELIGEANNINDTSFSANFGLGMDYSLSKQWFINLEPTFKYQLNTFNNTTGNFRPFFIGVYTGLSYKF